MSAVHYQEWADSQKPALTLLKKLGWTYISPEQAEKERGDILSVKSHNYLIS